VTSYIRVRNQRVSEYLRGHMAGIMRRPLKGSGVRYNTEAIGKVAPDRLAKWALIASGVVTAIYAVTSSALPFDWDQGMMASVGSCYIHGGLPYVNGWETKGQFGTWRIVQILRDSRMRGP
jgi:hypothetical protein